MWVNFFNCFEKEGGLNVDQIDRGVMGFENPVAVNDWGFTQSLYKIQSDGKDEEQKRVETGVEETTGGRG